MIRLELPFPPPLSACFKDVSVRSKSTGQTFRTRAPTGRYTAWQKDAHKMVDLQLRGKDRATVLMPGLVRVVVRLVAPDRRERDAGNMDKATLDFLVKAKIIENDSNRYVKRLTFAWEDEGLPCVVIVKPFVKGAEA